MKKYSILKQHILNTPVGNQTWKDKKRVENLNKSRRNKVKDYETSELSI